MLVGWSSMAKPHDLAVNRVLTPEPTNGTLPLLTPWALLRHTPPAAYDERERLGQVLFGVLVHALSSQLKPGTSRKALTAIEEVRRCVCVKEASNRLRTAAGMCCSVAAACAMAMGGC